MSNWLISTIAFVLATLCFIGPVFFGKIQRIHRIVFVVGVFISVFISMILIADTKTSTVVIFVACLFAALWQLILINYEMITTARNRKDERCY